MDAFMSATVFSFSNPGNRKDPMQGHKNRHSTEVGLRSRCVCMLARDPLSA